MYECMIILLRQKAAYHTTKQTNFSKIGNSGLLGRSQMKSHIKRYHYDLTNKRFHVLAK